MPLTYIHESNEPFVLNFIILIFLNSIADPCLFSSKTNKLNRNTNAKKTQQTTPTITTSKDCSLKALNTIGNCQRPVLSLGVSQHMHEITACRNLDSIKGFWPEVFYYLVRNYLFIKIYVTSEGAVSHNVLYYQHLSVACY